MSDAKDRILVHPVDDRAMMLAPYLGVPCREPEPLEHRCPWAVVNVVALRESLDPMALGTCRHCHQPLPVKS